MVHAVAKMKSKKQKEINTNRINTFGIGGNSRIFESNQIQTNNIF